MMGWMSWLINWVLLFDRFRVGRLPALDVLFEWSMWVKVNLVTLAAVSVATVLKLR